MKKLFPLIIFFMGSLSMTSQSEEKVTLTIEVSVTKYNKGKVMLALYNQEDHYMKKSYMNSVEKVKNHKVTMVFKNIEKGEYAYSLFHDVNDNGKLDDNFLGIPREPYSFSNEKPGTFGPPAYKKVKFTITDDMHQKITIK